MDHGQAETLSCPFCSFTDSDAYFLTQHVELCHPENGRSPFIAEREEGAESLEREANAGEYLDCPRGCGESILAADLPNHLNLHAAEDIALEDEETEVEQFEDTPVEFQLNSSRGIEHFDEELFLHIAQKALESPTIAMRTVEGTACMLTRPFDSTWRKDKETRGNIIAQYPQVRIANRFPSVQNLAPMLTRIRCPRGSVGCWRMDQGSFDRTA
jgi:hypothetical protein